MIIRLSMVYIKASAPSLELKYLPSVNRIRNLLEIPYLILYNIYVWMYINSLKLM